MSYYLEIWLRGFVKDYFGQISQIDKENYHPHITLIRPFDISDSEENVKQKIVDFCQGKSPIPFSLEGKGNFDSKINYILVINANELLKFNNDLECLLERDVEFYQKLNDEKILHITTNFEYNTEGCPRIDQYMLRLTGIRDNLIWFSYDFVTGEVLNRDESLNHSLWIQTVQRFSKKY